MSNRNKPSAFHKFRWANAHWAMTLWVNHVDSGLSAFGSIADMNSGGKVAMGYGVQLLLSDIRMPGRMDGLELARSIRAQHPEIKIVLASGESFSASHWGDTDGFFSKAV